MPKPKPTSIIRHEIILGRVEKDMMETVIAAWSFNRVATPLFDIFKDVSGMAVLILVFEKVTGIDVVLPGEATVEQMLAALDRGIENFRAQKKTEGVGEAEGFISSINYLVEFLRGEHSLT